MKPKNEKKTWIKLKIKKAFIKLQKKKFSWKNNLEYSQSKLRPTDSNSSQY